MGYVVHMVQNANDANFLIVRKLLYKVVNALLMEQRKDYV